LVCDTKGKESECAASQDQETGKNQNVENTREPVSRMTTLRQPELKNPAQPHHGPVKSEVALRVSKRQQPPGHDVGKTSESQKVEEEKQLPPAD
jgi:hypothetical protein